MLFPAHIQLRACIPSLLVKWTHRSHACSLQRSKTLFLLFWDNVLLEWWCGNFGKEARWAVGSQALLGTIWHLSSDYWWRLIYDVVVLAYVSKDFLPLNLGLLPLNHIIVRCLLLQPSKELLVLDRDLDKFSPAGIPVKTALLIIRYRLVVLLNCWKALLLSTVHNCSFCKFIYFLVALKRSVSWKTTIVIATGLDWGLSIHSGQSIVIHGCRSVLRIPIVSKVA